MDNNATVFGIMKRSVKDMFLENHKKHQMIQIKKIVTLPTSVWTKRPTFSQQLRIVPWGGKTLNFELANTCPMDNFVFISHTLMITHDKEIKSIGDPLYTTLKDTNNFILKNSFAEAKYNCLIHLTNPPAMRNGIIDNYGNEHGTFLVLFSETLETKFDSSCSDSACPLESISYMSKAVEVPALNQNGHQLSRRKYFNDCVKQWHENDTVSHCQRLTSKGTPCPRIRSKIVRRFVRNFPFFLPTNLDFFSKNKQLVAIEDLPEELKFQGSNKGSICYRSYAVTFGSGTHFISALELNNELSSKLGWYGHQKSW